MHLTSSLSVLFFYTNRIVDSFPDCKAFSMPFLSVLSPLYVKALIQKASVVFSRIINDIQKNVLSILIFLVIL